MLTKPVLKLLQNRNPSYYFLQRHHVLDDRFLAATSDEKVTIMVSWLFTWRGQEAINKFNDNIMESPEGIVYSNLVWLPVELLREFNVHNPAAALSGLIENGFLEPVEKDIYRLKWFKKATKKTVRELQSNKTRTRHTTKRRPPRPGFNGKRSYEIEEVA